MIPPKQNAPSRRLVIAVDGPAASGKGTLASHLAKHFCLPYLDTGSLYRAVGKKALILKRKQGNSNEIITPYDPANPQAPDTLLAIEAARSLEEKDLTARDLGSEWIGTAASAVSAVPEVRAALLEYQRNFAAQGKGAVLDGRDIGTVICPEATVKLFIIASPEVRAERRFKQQGDNPLVSLEDTLAAIRTRDERDMNRSTAPLKAASDAITLDTSTLTADETFARALAIIEKRIAVKSSQNFHTL